MSFAIIVAEDAECGIGKDGLLPWSLPEELKYFARITTETDGAENAVIMGRVTWESIPENRQPLKNRKNIVLSRNENYALPEDTILCSSWNEALDQSSSRYKIFVIGGGRVFHEAIQHPDCSEIYVTRIDKDFDCDTFFPKIYEDCFELAEESDPQQEGDMTYRFLKYKKI